MKVTTTMSKEEFNKWLKCLRRSETNTRQMPRVKPSLIQQPTPTTMQQVMVSWTIEDWRRAK
jgi:truncated hemoglobin YjbI